VSQGIPASLQPDEMVIEVTSKPDDFGRVQFRAFWHDARTLAEGGPPAHVRGQVFYAGLDQFIARTLRVRVTVVRHEPAKEES